MKKTASLALITSLALGLSACGGMGGSKTESPASGSNQPTATGTVSETPEPEAPAESEPESSLTGEDPGILQLGESFTYSDGLQITVGKPSAFTSSEWAMPESAPALAFDIKIVNGTNAPYDPSMDFFSAQIGNTEAEEVFDSEQGFEGSPMTKVRPGREAAYKIAFAGTDTKNLVLEYQPGDWEHGSLIFTPNGK